METPESSSKAHVLSLPLPSESDSILHEWSPVGSPPRLLPRTPGIQTRPLGVCPARSGSTHGLSPRPTPISLPSSMS